MTIELGGTGLDRYVHSVVRSQPNPPRKPSLIALLASSYLTRVSRLLVAFGVMLTLGGVAVGLLAIGPFWQRAIIFVMSGLALAMFAGAPTFRAMRYYVALRDGIRVEAEVVESTWTPPAFRPPTLEAGSYGTGRGVRRVLHPVGEFEQSFEIEEPWASQLKAGDRLMLLTEAKLPRVLMELGPLMYWSAQPSADR